MDSQSQPTATTDLPEKLGRYHVLGVAGRGNMGVVYTGYDPETNLDVAVKVCSLDQMGNTGSRALIRKLFFNEAHTAGLLDHPNIVKVMDAGEQDGQLYLVMEYVDGAETLSDYCQPDRLVPLETVGQIAHTCARALDYAHRRGVIHRDIKPSNILVTRSGLLKIGDFGIAQSMISDATQVIGLMGSPTYMSPEQVREEPLTGQTDLYSLGVVMYQLLSGRRPYNARSLPALVEKILREAPLAIRQLRADLPEPLAGVVERAMSKDLGERYPSGRDMASDIAAIFNELEEPDQSLSEDIKFQMVRQLRIFSEFSDPEVWEILRASRWSDHPCGERIDTVGNVDTSFFIIVTGEVAVLKEGRVIASLHRGDCFGETGLVGEAEDSAAVLATEDVALLKLHAESLEHASPSCQLHFYKAFVHIMVERLTRGQGPRGPQAGARPAPSS